MAKTNSIRVNTGRITLEVNDNGDKISFVPDVLFAEKIYQLIDEVEVMLKEYETKQVHATEKEQIQMVKELCISFNSKIDDLFGEHASEKIFEGAMVAEAYIDFLEQITPFIEQSRKKVEKKIRENYLEE